jgi:uncharacterized protein (DUF58 family)
MRPSASQRFVEIAPGPHRPSVDVARAAALLELVWRPSTGSGTSGERLGRSLGASAEFAEHRSYAPGDDVRHIDWRVYARSDQLMVRAFREEIAPRLDVVLDLSRSLAVDAQKAGGAVDLAALWVAWGRSAGFATRLLALDGGLRTVSPNELVTDGLVFDGRVPLERALDPLAGLTAGGVRVVISDWMTPVPAADLFTRAFARASAGLALAVWHADELAPPSEGALRLVDAETGAEREVEFDGARRARFTKRLKRWREDLSEGARHAGVPFVEWPVPVSLVDGARERLGPLGLVGAH